MYGFTSMKTLILIALFLIGAASVPLANPALSLSIDLAGDGSINVELLKDIRTAFGDADKIRSDDPVEKLCAEFSLKLQNLLRQRRLSYSLGLRGTCECPISRNGAKITQLMNFHEESL